MMGSHQPATQLSASMCSDSDRQHLLSQQMSHENSRPHSTGGDQVEGQPTPEDTTPSSNPFVLVDDQLHLGFDNSTAKRHWRHSWQASSLDKLRRGESSGDVGVRRDVSGIFSPRMLSPVESRRASSGAPDERDPNLGMESQVQLGVKPNFGCNQTSQWRTLDYFIWVVRWALVVIILLGVIGGVVLLSIRSAT